MLARVQATYPDWRQITVGEGYYRRPDKPPAIEPFSAVLQPGGGIPAFALTQLVLDPHAGEIVTQAGYADQTPGRKVRT